MPGSMARRRGGARGRGVVAAAGARGRGRRPRAARCAAGWRCSRPGRRCCATPSTRPATSPSPTPRPARAVSLGRLASAGLAEAGADSAHALGVHQNAGRLGESWARRGRPPCTRGPRAPPRCARTPPAHAGSSPRWPGARSATSLDRACGPSRRTAAPTSAGWTSARSCAPATAARASSPAAARAGSSAELVLGREPFTDPAPFDPERPRA